MQLFHVTPRRNVSPILANGFVDPNAGRYSDAGVWFASQPLVNDEMFEGEVGPFGGICIEVPEQVVIEYEQEMPEGSTHREWHLPHEVANSYIESAQQVDFLPEGYVETYDGYYIVRLHGEAEGGSIGGVKLRAPTTWYQAIAPDTDQVVAEGNLQTEVMLYVHNNLPRKA